MKKPLVSVLVLTFNEKQWVSPLLKSLQKQSFKNFEVVIVDNGSSDGTAQFLKKNFPAVKLVRNSKNLGTPGYNNGIGHCRGEFILFIATDMELERNCIKNFVKEMRADNSIALCGPKVVNYYDHNKVDINGTWLSHAFYGGAIRTHELKKTTETPFYGIGMVRKAVIEKIGCLYDDDYFFYGEDVDLCLKIRLMGMKVVAVPTAVIYHRGFQVKKVWSRRHLTFLIERNQLTNFLRTFSPPAVVLLAPIVFGARFLVFLKDLLRRDFERAAARAKAVLWVLSHPSFIARKRRISQSLRKAPDSFVLKVFSEGKVLTVAKHILFNKGWN